jgi:TetR/AcrR family transcriptional regulator, regulator of cefoperazone and chloramphenicol sensitivity
MQDRDRQTRERLLRVAARLFAERGFKRVTVREICRAARANVAAVNYHFGDKLQLYCEVVRMAVTTMRETSAAAKQAGEGGTADEKLRAYIRVFVQQIGGSSSASWIHQLMSWELANPTPALDLVIREVIEPRLAYLGTLVADLLDCPVDDVRVARCAISIHGCILLIRNPVLTRLYPDISTPSAVEALADHIASFALAGIRGMSVDAPAASLGSPVRRRRGGEGRHL